MAGVGGVSVGEVPTDTHPVPVAVSLVPQGTPAARTLQPGDPDSAAVLVRKLVAGSLLDVEPAEIQGLSDEARGSAPLGFSRGADYVRVWRRGARKDGERIVTALAAPLTGTDPSPDGILLVATESGVNALQIRREQTDTFPAA
ncbi:hypothetical protein ACFV9W_00270 [Streptomyces sp. NPDC059897]|uniref:hypothetical protein n=1 Tax=Streptomyces sp. NPDC059897 TaxID=3346994 RepID=UPI00365AECB2